MKFAKDILDDEWKEFEEIQDRVIRMYTNRVSGTLRNEFNNRKYDVREGGDEVKASLQHPDYERFLDMKKDRIVNRTYGRVFKDQGRIERRKGRNIHNRIIFGRLNPITFRLMHELMANVIQQVRNRP